MGAYSSGGSTIFLIVVHIPVEIFLLVNYLVDATHKSNRRLGYFSRTGKFSLMIICCFFPSSI